MHASGRGGSAAGRQGWAAQHPSPSACTQACTEALGGSTAWQVRGRAGQSSPRWACRASRCSRGAARRTPGEGRVGLGSGCGGLKMDQGGLSEACKCPHTAPARITSSTSTQRPSRGRPSTCATLSWSARPAPLWTNSRPSAQRGAGPAPQPPPSPHLRDLVVVGGLQLGPAHLLGVRDVLAQQGLGQDVGVAVGRPAQGQGQGRRG